MRIFQPPAGTPDQLATARDRYFAEVDELVGPGFSGRIIDKMPFYLVSLPLIASLFPDAKIIFAGRGSPPVYAEALRTYAALVGLGGQVEFLGVVGPIEKLVAAADGVLLPSRYEGLPNAVVESIASAKTAVLRFSGRSSTSPAKGLRNCNAPRWPADPRR